jgi:hypothetical protein
MGPRYAPTSRRRSIDAPGGGFAAALMSTVMAGLDPDREVTQADVDYLARLQRELEAFSADARTERA